MNPFNYKILLTSFICSFFLTIPYDSLAITKSSFKKKTFLAQRNYQYEYRYEWDSDEETEETGDVEFVNKYLKEIQSLMTELEKAPDEIIRLKEKLQALNLSSKEENEDDEDQYEETNAKTIANSIKKQEKILLENKDIIRKKIQTAATKAVEEAKKTEIKVDSDILITKADQDKKEDLIILEKQKTETKRLIASIERISSLAVKESAAENLSKAVEILKQALTNASLVSSKIEKIASKNKEDNNQEGSLGYRTKEAKNKLNKISDDVSKIVAQIKAKTILNESSNNPKKEQIKADLLRKQSEVDKVQTEVNRIFNLAINALENKKIAEAEAYTEEASKLSENLPNITEESKLGCHSENYKDKIKSKDLQECDLKEANISGTNFENYTNFSRAIFIEAQANKVILVRAKLIKVQAKNSNFSDSNLNFSDATDIDLSSSQLIGTKFISTKLKNSDLSDSKCNNADFKNANVSGANFDNADLSGAKNLDQTIGSVKNCPKPKMLPKGLKCSTNKNPSFHKVIFDTDSPSNNPKNWGG